MQGKVSNWTAAEILLGMAVLALAVPREDGFVLPERRDWTGWLRRLLPKARRRREEEAGYEAERYVTDLRTDRDQPLMTLRQDQLPSMSRVHRPPLASPPSALKPPWKTAENPGWGLRAAPQEPPGGEPKRRRRAPGDPPTVVIEIMRPAMEGDLRRYLEELPAYADDDLSAGVFVPRASLALGAPDHDGAPEDVDDDGPQEADLAPLQGGVVDVELKEEPGREERPRD